MTLANKSLQATGAAPSVLVGSVLDGVGDWLLPGFVVASFPRPVPELGRSATQERWCIRGFRRQEVAMRQIRTGKGVRNRLGPE